MNAHIAHHLKTVHELAWRTKYLGALLMSNIQDENDEIAKLGAAVADFEAREVATKAALQKQIDDLTAAGSPDTAPQIAALQAILDTIPAAPPAP